MLKLSIIRHGETDFNAQGIVQGGGIDSSLNATGRRQAEAFWRKHHSSQFAPTVWGSSLVRTHQTLAPFIDAGYELKTHSGLNEFNWGKWEGQRFDRDFREIIQPYVLEWQAGNLDLAVPGGESPKQAWHRAQAAFAEILSNHSAGNVLVCSHGRLIRILLAGVLNNDLRLMQQYPHENTGLYILARPSAQDAFVVEKANCVAHLD